MNINQSYSETILRSLVQFMFLYQLLISKLKKKLKPQTLRSCILLEKAMPIQSGCAEDHCNWFISEPAE